MSFSVFPFWAFQAVVWGCGLQEGMIFQNRSISGVWNCDTITYIYIDGSQRVSRFTCSAIQKNTKLATYMTCHTRRHPLQTRVVAASTHLHVPSGRCGRKTMTVCKLVNPTKDSFFKVKAHEVSVNIPTMNRTLVLVRLVLT